MKHIIKLFLVLSVIQPGITFSQLDFKHDSVVYRTIYPSDFCDFLKSNPQTVLIDVRTPGEFADTSHYGSLNIGHLKGAINIPIDSISKKLAELKTKSSLPIVLYCSHSQRSRRVSKTLVENGFDKVWNLNGGLSFMNQANETDFPCKKEMVVSSLSYKSLPADETINLIKNSNDIIIIDVRSASEYNSNDTLESLNIGHLKNAINIPAADLKNSLDKIDKNKTILVYDENGSGSNGVAKYLSEHGYTKIYNLLGGLSALIGKERETTKTRKELLVNIPSYNILNVREVVNLILKKNDLIILDVRIAEEFNNKSKNKWRNLGHIKNAVNIPPSEFAYKINELLKHKKSTLIIYGSDEAALYCKELKLAGFENVNLLYGGLWDVVSASFNIQSLKEIKSLLVDHEGLY